MLSRTFHGLSATLPECACLMSILIQETVRQIPLYMCVQRVERTEIKLLPHPSAFAEKTPARHLLPLA
ncbi:hypothetical protein AAHC03_013155 [Spirometra sp. Aus1]